MKRSSSGMNYFFWKDFSMIISYEINRGDKMISFKNLPNIEKPREKIFLNGVETLSNEELLMVLLRSGTKKKSVKGVSLDTPFTSEYTQSRIAHIPGIFNSTKNLINVLRHFLYVHIWVFFFRGNCRQPPPVALSALAWRPVHHGDS